VDAPLVDGPLVVGLGGTLRPGSSTERLLRCCLRAAELRGARVQAFCGDDIDLPMYNPQVPGRSPRAARLVSAIRDADAVVVASPGYHGGVSGLVKNALDYIEDLRDEPRAYLDGRPFGAIAGATGWQAAVAALGQLRSTGHALRAWPTPLGLAVNTAEPVWNDAGQLTPDMADRVETLAGQLLSKISVPEVRSGVTLGLASPRDEAAMCRGGRLIADFAAGTEVRPDLPGTLDEHLTTTVDGLWVVWAYKLARCQGDLYVPLTGGSGYPADAKAECRPRSRYRGGDPAAHDAPQPGCTCGFHALSSQSLPGLPVHPGLTKLTVALSGRVLAFEWAGAGVLWRAERQTVVRIDQPGALDWAEEAPGRRHYPGDPAGSLAAVSPAVPRDSGPVRLELPASPAILPVSHDDAGWCAESRPFRRVPAALALA
jgi:FMN reductase